MKDFTFYFLQPLAVNVFLLIFICASYNNNFILTMIVVSFFLFALLTHYSRYRLILAIVSIVFGTIGEIVCCAKAVELWRYKNPTIWGIPIWLPMVWPVIMMTSTDMADYLHGVVEDKLGKKYLMPIRNIMVFLILIYSFYTFFRIQIVIASVLLCFLLLMLLFARKPFNLILFCVASLGSTIGEYVCLKHHVWYYTRPFFSHTGIPLSLPLAWGLSSAIITLAAIAISKINPDLLSNTP